MSGRDHEPWQRRIRQSREQGGWQDATMGESPRDPEPVPQPRAQPSPPPMRKLGDGARDDDVWRASASFGKLIGFVLVAALPIFALVSFWRFRVTDGLWSYVALAAAVLLVVATAGAIYILRGLATMRYILGSDRITIVWMGERRVIPFGDIQDVVYEPRVHVPRRGYEGFWPGYHVSTMQMRDGAWQSVATQPPHRRIRIVTRTGVHAISPRRPVLFLGELGRRRQEFARGGATMSLPASMPVQPRTSAPPVTQREPVPGVVIGQGAPPWKPVIDDGQPVLSPMQQLQETDARAGRAPARAGRRPGAGWLTGYAELFRERLLGDQIASGLVAVGVMIPLLMAAFLYSQYEGINAVTPLHWNAHGDVDAVGTPRDVWRLPLIAVLVLLLNTTLATALLAVDRFMARLLAAVTPGVQLLVFVALVRMVS